MPVTTDTLWNMRRTNIVFGVSSVLMLVSFFWMMKHDMDRKWRGFQTQYFNARSGLAHLTYLAYLSPDQQNELKKLESSVDSAREALDSGAIKEIEEKIGLMSGELEGVSLEYGNTNAALGVIIFNLNEKQAFEGMSSEATEAKKAEYDAKTTKLAKLKTRKDAIEDELRQLKDRLKSIQQPLVAAEKELSTFAKGMKDAETADQRFGPGLVRTTLNAPILDYAPPHDIPGRQEVKNLFMQNIRFDYNFTDSYVTDRCTTCHIGIDDPTMTRANLVKQAEQALKSEQVAQVLRRENEELVKELGRRLAEVDTTVAKDRHTFVNRFISAANGLLQETKRPKLENGPIQAAFESREPDRGLVQSEIESQFRRILAAAPPHYGQVAEKRKQWADMEDEEQDRYFKSLIAAVNLYMANNDEKPRPEIENGTVIAAHPRLDLFLSPTSPHPMKTMGCTVCHEGSGQETDFIFAAHTPKTEEEKHEWEHDYGESELKLPMNSFHVVEEFWERPMLLSQYTSASCAKCHQQVYDLDKYRTAPMHEAAPLVEGRELFTRVGCINCHNVEGLSDSRRVGTDLTHVKSKLTAGFMERWIEYPNNFRPSTRMPHFFHQENNVDSAGRTEEGYNEFDPHPELRTETEIQAIAHYLNTFSKSLDSRPTPDGIEADPARGEALFVSIGCLACHANLDAHDPIDDEKRTFGEKWIVRDIAIDRARAAAKKDKANRPELTAESQQELIDAEMDGAKAAYEAMSKNDRVRYASRRFTRQSRLAAQLSAKTEAFLAETEDGRDPKPFEMYVPPEFTMQGPELSGLGTKLVPDAGDESQREHGMNWLYNWLRDPRHYSSYTMMPRMFRDHYYQQSPPDEQRLKNDQDMMDVASFLLSLRNDDFDMSQIADDEEHRDMRETLIRELLGGQNTASVVDLMYANEPAAGESGGPLTTAIVNQTAASFGGGDDGRQRVEALIAATSGSAEDRRKLFLGMKMISHYGCYACHTIAGFEDATRPGTDVSTWAQKFMSQLDFAFYSHVFEHEREAQPQKFDMLYRGDLPDNRHLIRDIGEDAPDLIAQAAASGDATAGNVPQHILHNHASFAYHKIRNPRIWDRNMIRRPYEKLKMPNYFFTEEESVALTTYILSRRSPGVREPVKVKYNDTPVGRVARGRELARQLNCIGCHTIEGGDAATIHQYYSSDVTVSDNFPFGPRFKPPVLWGEGAKIQNDWLFKFFNNVEMLRPWLNARMPSFYLTTEEATILVEYFAGLAQDEADFLGNQTLPVEKYLQQVHGAAADSQADPHWFLIDRFKDEASFLKTYALRHNLTRVYDFDDSQATTRDERANALERGYELAVGKANFLESLYDIPYPFTDPASHAIDENRFRLGEEFFYDLKCLACHVAGDPSVLGTTTEIKAPNFALTAKRLRYDWVQQWLQDPQAIQPGANMPQIFQGGHAYAGLPEEQRQEKEIKFGDSAEGQSQLLIDFLFELGHRNYTAIQPGAAEAAAEAAKSTESGGEIDFDFDGGGDEKKEEEVDIDF